MFLAYKVTCDECKNHESCYNGKSYLKQLLDELSAHDGVKLTLLETR